MSYRILYPETRVVSAAWIIGQARDLLATEYLRANPGADDAAIEENSRLRPDAINEAIDLLSDAGVVTFARDDRGAARLTVLIPSAALLGVVLSIVAVL